MLKFLSVLSMLFMVLLPYSVVNANPPVNLLEQVPFFEVEELEMITNISYLQVTAPRVRTVEAERELQCLTANIYFEARGESEIGKIAVANVTINRVDSIYFPSSICEVVYERNRRTCQFSWTCNRNESEMRREQELVSRRVAERVYDGHRDVTRGAEFYHANYVNPGWRGVRYVTTIGAHRFYVRR